MLCHLWSSFSRKIRHNPRGTFYWFEFFESFHLMYWFEFFETMMYGILGCIGFEMTLFASKHMLELFESIHLSYRYRATSWFKFSNQFIWCLHSNFSNQSVYRIIIVIVLCHLWCPSFVKKFNTTKEPLIDSNFSNQFIWCIHSNFSNHVQDKATYSFEFFESFHLMSSDVFIRIFRNNDLWDYTGLHWLWNDAIL